jgi:beta-lactam-binding protein with PASTA domain
MKSKMTTRHLYVAGDSTLHYEEVTRFLNSKGFKVRTKKAYTDSGIEKTHYNNSDIILGC